MEEKELREKIIREMIIDKLFNCLQKNSKGKIYFDDYKLDGKDMVYLLEKYDNQKFNEYKELLLNDEE